MAKLFSNEELDNLTSTQNNEPVTCLGVTFANDDERRAYFREELRKKLPELKQIEGFPIGEDDDIIALSDPPYYTACPNPWLNDFIAEWEEEKKQLIAEGKRDPKFNIAEPYAFGIKEQKNNPVYIAHSYHTKVPPEVIMNYYLYYTQPGDIVLDGFAGTGMAGVAANFCEHPTPSMKKMFDARWSERLNKQVQWGYRKCVLGDLSPITSYITYNYTNKISGIAFRKVACDIYRRLKEELGYLYEINDKLYGQCTIKYFVWSELQLCPNCDCQFVLWDQSVDIKNDVQREVYLCPSCGCKIMKRNSRKSISTQFDFILGKSIEQVDMVPVFINFEDSKGRRHERELTLEEREYFRAIPNDTKCDVPISLLHEGDKTTDPHRLGIFYLHQFYSRRNLLILSRFKELIEQYDCDERMKAYLRIWFSSSQSRLHMMNRYAVKHHRHVGPLANTLYVSSTPTEISPFYFISTKIDDNALDVCAEHNVINQITSATTSSLPDNSIDYIFTDPPFGANIMYSELNFLWESWLGIRTDNKEEAIVNKTQNKKLPDYQNIMLRCFKEYYRVLKPGKWMTVEFSNTSAAVWNSIQLALQQSGFVVATVTDLNKGRAGLHGIIGVVAVNQDLAISCYKPHNNVVNAVKSLSSGSVWEFVEDYITHLSVVSCKEDKILTMSERSPKILYDRLISYFVEHGQNIPINAIDFQKELKERFVERDGMFFTAEQVLKYEDAKAKSDGLVPLGLFVSSEAEGIQWLKNKLQYGAKTYQQLQPDWMQDLVKGKKGDLIPELQTILDENFIRDEDGAWHIPNPEKEADLEALRCKRLQKEFNLYVEQASKPKVKIKEARLEALRYGFKECYRNKDFQTIYTVAMRIPEALLTEDEVLLQYYDIACTRVIR